MKRLSTIGLLIAALLIFVRAASAQGVDPDLVLRMTRDFGYGGFANDIEGLFSLIAEGPQDLTRVDFYIDDEILFSDKAAPFRFQFTTKDYAPGEHRLHARGFTASGAELRSNAFVRDFLSPEEARQKTVGLIFPLLGVVGGILLIVGVVPFLIGRRKPEIGKYGLSGGAVCSQCGLPLPIHFFGIHMGASHLERCPHCGKWVLARKAKPEDLRAAENRWRGEESQPARKAGDERLRRQIDDSRYIN